MDGDIPSRERYNWYVLWQNIRGTWCRCVPAICALLSTAQRLVGQSVVQVRVLQKRWCNRAYCSIRTFSFSVSGLVRTTPNKFLARDSPTSTKFLCCLCRVRNLPSPNRTPHPPPAFGLSLGHHLLNCSFCLLYNLLPPPCCLWFLFSFSPSPSDTPLPHPHPAIQSYQSFSPIYLLAHTHKPAR